MINHKVLLFVGAMAASAAVTISAYGQTTVSPKELGQIVDEAMRNVLPPTQMASRVPVSSRKVRFDKVRTAAAFGLPQTTELQLKTANQLFDGSKDLLDDCPTVTSPRQQCQHLGWSIYTWIDPVSITKEQAVIRVHVYWPDRLTAPFEEGVAPKGRAVLVGFASNLYLDRNADGRWVFQKRADTKVY